MKAKPESPWRLRFDLLSARLLLLIAGAGRTGDPTPEAHAYLAHCYVRLAAYMTATETVLGHVGFGKKPTFISAMRA